MCGDAPEDIPEHAGCGPSAGGQAFFPVPSVMRTRKTPARSSRENNGAYGVILQRVGCWNRVLHDAHQALFPRFTPATGGVLLPEAADAGDGEFPQPDTRPPAPRPPPPAPAPPPRRRLPAPGRVHLRAPHVRGFGSPRRATCGQVFLICGEGASSSPPTADNLTA